MRVNQIWKGVIQCESVVVSSVQHNPHNSDSLGDCSYTCDDVIVECSHLGCGFPVSFELPPLPGKPSSVCLATEFA